MILLDTCSLLWLNGDRKLFTARALKALNRHADALSFSPISILEVGIKANKGKLELPLTVSAWFEQLCADYSLIEIPLNVRIAKTVTELPLLHSDPLDRILLATAKVHRLSVVTSDNSFQQYPGVRVIW